MEAHRDADRAPADPDGRLAWVRRLFLNNLKDEVSKLGAACRNVAREVRRGDHFDPETDGWLDSLPADLSSPSRIATRAEEVLRLMTALDGLPCDWRTAVEYRYLLGLGIGEVAARMGRSRAAAAGLLRRGLVELRARLTSSARGDH